MKEKIKVLLVEDELTLAMIIKDTLEENDFTLTIAANGEEGLRMFFDIRPDVLVADVMMPRMDGFDYEADPDAEYEKTIEIDLSALEPTVSYPHLPENTHLASEGKEIKIDQVVIGSCTNGRLEDMEAAYNVLKGKHIAKGVRGIIIPATMAVYKECILRGWTTAFIDAGCIVSTPTCGPCLGGHMGILAEGERCVSTTNRNFVGRMGHVKSEVYLASPATAAASALTGYITDPRTV